MPRLSAPLYTPPFASPIDNALEDEYRAMRWLRRFNAVRKMLHREGWLRTFGQATLRRERVPATVRKLLWIYTWTTVGDAIMDLAARALIPSGIEVELCIPPSLAPLFRHDGRFSRVHVDVAECGSGFDFVLLDCLSTAAIRSKARYFANVPFASVRGHQLGERFDRAAFGDRRIRQLFGLALDEVICPWLSVTKEEAGHTGSRYRIAVTLGARVEIKHYTQWPAALAQLRSAWPSVWPSPRFVLLGHGPSADADLLAFDTRFLTDHCDVAIQRKGDLRDAAVDLAGCNMFLGVDGGLMHIAVAVRVPGLALFTRNNPNYFLRPRSGMTVLHTEGPIDSLGPALVASQALDRLRSLNESDGGRAVEVPPALSLRAISG